MSESGLSITTSEQARSNRADQVDGRDAIPSSMVAEHGSIAGETATLTEAIRVQAEAVLATAGDLVDPVAAIRAIYENLNEFMKTEANNQERPT